jgi:hypothetical protein
MSDDGLMGSDGLQDMTGALFADIPEGKCCMAVMGKAGDSKYMWDPNNTVESEIAEKTFKEYRKKGYLAFKVTGKDGERGDQMTEWDARAGRVIFVPAMAGGAGSDAQA